VPQGHRRDVESCRQLLLRRQPLSRGEQSGPDRLADATHDLLDRSLRLQRPEHELVRLDLHMI